MAKREKIVRLNYEGKPVTLYGIRRWYFAVEPILESAPRADDSYSVTDALDAALAPLDKSKLIPLSPVHPNFRTAVRSAIQRHAMIMTREAFERWRKICKKPDRNMIAVDEKPLRAWPELIYRLVEHYKWEPQHLYAGQSRERFYEGIRKQEVPLNYLFCLFLRLSQSGTIREILRRFELDAEHPDFADVQLEYPSDQGYTQPDIRLESAKARIYIEVKVDSKVDLAQVQKYLYLHAEMNMRDAHPKKPYLLFLTRDEFPKCWDLKDRDAEANDIVTFISERIKDDTLPKTFPSKFKNSQNTIAAYKSVLENIRYGATTWQSIGNCLKKCQAKIGKHQIDFRIHEDFLADLNRRELWISE